MTNIFSDVIDSKYESNLLAFLLLAPKRTFSIKELTGRLAHTNALLSRAAVSLQRKNLLQSVVKSGSRFYYLNPRNRMVAEMRSEFRKMEKPWSDELFLSLKKLGQMEGIYLSGLFVGQPQLPVDILLVGKVNLSKLDEFLKQLIKVIGVDVNYSIMTKDEFELRKGTFDRFIKDIFDYHHLVVHEGSATKPTSPRKRAVKKKSSKKVSKLGTGNKKSGVATKAVVKKKVVKKSVSKPKSVASKSKTKAPKKRRIRKTTTKVVKKTLKKTAKKTPKKIVKKAVKLAKGGSTTGGKVAKKTKGKRKK